MPELPEVETVRRMLEHHVVGRTVRSVRLSGKRLRIAVSRTLPSRLRRRTVRAVRRHGKYLLVDFDREITVLSHLGMSGRWLFFPSRPKEAMPHVHVEVAFEDGSWLWFQDPRRFGLIKALDSERAFRDPALASLGPDPVLALPEPDRLVTNAKGSKTAIKNFLLDQKRIAGIGNIYASEILHRAGIDPRRRAGSLSRREWVAVATEIPRVLFAAIERMGTTFSTYRTLWNEPGSYGERLLVYDRASEPCRKCGTPIRRIVQGQRSTFFCPTCQRRGAVPAPRRSRSG